MKLLPFLALLLIGCGSDAMPKPTANEIEAFKGKEITPEQRAKGMAAAMGSPVKSMKSPAGG